MELCIQFFEQGNLPCADPSPGRPKIEQDCLAPEVIGIKPLTAAGLSGEMGCRPADSEISNLVNIALSIEGKLRTRCNPAHLGEGGHGIIEVSRFPIAN